MRPSATANQQVQLGGWRRAVEGRLMGSRRTLEMQWLARRPLHFAFWQVGGSAPLSARMRGANGTIQPTIGTVI